MNITLPRAVIEQALEALENNKQNHHYCEDTWYSCPKHEEGCANDSEGDECNCGADEINAQFDKAITALRTALEQPEQEPVAHFGSAYINENGVHITTVLGPVAIPQDAKLYIATPQTTLDVSGHPGSSLIPANWKQAEQKIEMNERIKELAEHAGLEFDEDLALESEPIYYITQKTLEKFAELILQDIDKIVDNLYHSLPLEQAAVLLTLDENIKEHFYGVDE